MSKVIRPIANDAITRARRNLVDALEAGRLHLHLRINKGGCDRDLANWCVTFQRTALCKSDRCMWVVKKE